MEDDEPSVMGAGSYGTNPMPSEPQAYQIQETLKGAMVGDYRHRPRLLRLKDAKRGLESKLAEVNKAIALLEKNPEMNELMEAIERAGV